MPAVFVFSGVVGRLTLPHQRSLLGGMSPAGEISECAGAVACPSPISDPDGHHCVCRHCGVPRKGHALVPLFTAP